ncbi:MAG: hypothetical protein ACN2B6_07245 [Rickettsiales bacterium]
MAEEKASGVAATAQQTVSARAEKEASEPKKFLQRYSLKIAGFLNLLGDVGLLASGIKNKDTYRTAGGGLYTLGALNLAGFGDVDKDYMLRNVSERTAEYLQKHTDGLPVGSELAKALEQKKTGTLASANRVLRSRPAQHTLGLYTGGAAAMFGSGIQNYRQGKGVSGLAYGASSLTIKIASLMIPEESKKAHPGDKPKGFVGWIKEKPLRLFGYGSFVTDTLLAWTAHQEHRNNPGEKGYLLTAVSSVAYMVSDIMMAMSNKDPANSEGAFTAADKDKLASMAATVIASKPQSQRDQLTDQIADFLSRQPEITDDETAIRQSLRKRVASMSGSSWAARAEQESAVDLQR